MQLVAAHRLHQAGEMARKTAWTGLVIAFGVGCAGTDADLPAGWEDAARIESLVQHECKSGSAIESPEGVRFAAGPQDLEVAYDHAHFRCEQKVEGFVRESAAAIELLVQPVEMDPSAVAGCDCRYDIAIRLPIRSGRYVAKLYRRWDNINDPNLPVAIGESTLTVP